MTKGVQTMVQSSKVYRGVK